MGKESKENRRHLAESLSTQLAEALLGSMSCLRSSTTLKGVEEEISRLTHPYTHLLHKLDVVQKEGRILELAAGLAPGVWDHYG